MRNAISITLMVMMLLLLAGPAVGSEEDPDLEFAEPIQIMDGGEPGDIHTIIVKVTNSGGSPAENVDVALYIDGRPKKVQTLRTVENGSKDVKTVIFSWVAEEGIHTIECRIDPADTIQESDEGNNDAYREIEVGDGPVVTVDEGSSVVLLPIILLAIIGIMGIIGAILIVGIGLAIWFATRK